MEETGFGVLRGQGRQELRRHRVPLRPPAGQALRRRDRGGPRARALRTSPSRSASCSRCCRSRTRPRPRCSSRSSRPRRATPSIFRPSARAARCAERAIEIAPAPRARRPGCRRTRCRSSPTPRSTSRSTSSTTRASTSSGPPAARRPSRATNEAGKPCIGVGPGNAPVYVHRSADVADGGRRHPDLQDLRRVGDLPGRADARRRRRRSTTTLVAELERMGARLLTEGEVDALAAVAFEADGRMRIEALGQRCADARRAGRHPARRRRQGPARAAARRTSTALADHPLVQREADARARARALALGRARDRRVRARHRARRPRATRRPSTPSDDDGHRRASPSAIRTGRILVNAPTAVGALGGVYNAMTPTFSLGCGTWGGSTTTDERQLPQPAQRQGRLAPPDAAAVVPRAVGRRTSTPARSSALREAGGRTGADRHRRRHRGARRAPTRCGACSAPAAVHVFADVEPEPGEARDPRRRRAPARRCDAGPHRGRRRRLGDRRRQGDAPALTSIPS